jgi:hypothetical protein
VVCPHEPLLKLGIPWVKKSFRTLEQRAAIAGKYDASETYTTMYRLKTSSS